MNMVSDPTNSKRYRAFTADNATYIFKHTIQIFIAYNYSSTFRVKNDVSI